LTLLDFTWLYLNIHRMIHFIYVSLSAAARNFSVSGNLHSVSKFIFYCAVLYYTLPCFSLHNTLHFTYVFTMLFFTQHTSFYLREILSSHVKGLFCRISSLLYGFFAKETYHLKDTQCIVLTWDSQQPREISQSRKTRIQPWRPVWHDFFEYAWHDSLTCVTRPIHLCDMTHPYVWMTFLYVWHESCICVTWLSHVCDGTYFEFTYVTWLIHLCHETCSYVWHDSSIYVTGLF